MFLPPMGIVRSGLRGVIVNSDGARAIISITKSRAHAHVGAINRAASVFQDRNGFGVQEFNADLFEDSHCAVVDRLNTVLVKWFRRSVIIDGHAPRHLVDGALSAPLAIARAPA